MSVARLGGVIAEACKDRNLMSEIEAKGQIEPDQEMERVYSFNPGPPWVGVLDLGQGRKR